MDTIIFILNCKEAYIRNQEREQAKQQNSNTTWTKMLALLAQYR